MNLLQYKEVSRSQRILYWIAQLIPSVLVLLINYIVFSYFIDINTIYTKVNESLLSPILAGFYILVFEIVLCLVFSLGINLAFFYRRIIKSTAGLIFLVSLQIVILPIVQYAEASIKDSYYTRSRVDLVQKVLNTKSSEVAIQEIIAMDFTGRRTTETELINTLVAALNSANDADSQTRLIRAMANPSFALQLDNNKHWVYPIATAIVELNTKTSTAFTVRQASFATLKVHCTDDTVSDNITCVGLWELTKASLNLNDEAVRQLTYSNFFDAATMTNYQFDDPLSKSALSAIFSSFVNEPNTSVRANMAIEMVKWLGSGNTHYNLISTTNSTLSIELVNLLLSYKDQLQPLANPPGRLGYDPVKNLEQLKVSLGGSVNIATP